jgi:hypothetical protein
MNLDLALSDDAIDNLPAKMDEAENLTEEARQLLVRCKTSLTGEGVREEALALERWLESYRRGISAAQKLSDRAPELLENMSTRIRQALAELQRYEEEGGNPATKTQQAQIEEISQTLSDIQQFTHLLKDASFVDMQKKAV